MMEGAMITVKAERAKLQTTDIQSKYLWRRLFAASIFQPPSYQAARLFIATCLQPQTARLFSRAVCSIGTKAGQGIVLNNTRPPFSWFVQEV